MRYWLSVLVNVVDILRRLLYRFVLVDVMTF
jgi:hypothetical protein